MQYGCTHGDVPSSPTKEERWVPGRLLVQPRAAVSEPEFEETLRPVGGKSIERIDGINVHVVELPSHASEKAVAALLAKNPRLVFAELDRLVCLIAISRRD